MLCLVLSLTPCCRPYLMALKVTSELALRRWGDSPLRWFQAMLYLDWHAEVHHFGFHYAHKIYHYNQFVGR